jgi:hypothetical protein
MLDVLTPAYASYEMAAEMPNAELRVQTFGTHFVLLEYPDRCAKWIKAFLEGGDDKKKKKGGGGEGEKGARSRSRTKSAARSRSRSRAKSRTRSKSRARKLD